MQKSWVDKMLECIRNRDKQAKKKVKDSTNLGSPTAKRQRLVAPKDDLLRRYPARIMDESVDDMYSVKQHKKAMEDEFKKAKPRDSVLLPLMKSTFKERRMFVQDDARSVEDILDAFPSLCRPALVSIMSHYMCQGFIQRGGRPGISPPPPPEFMM